MSRRRNRSPMTMMSSQNHRTNMNTAKASARKLRKVKPSEKKNIAVSPGSTGRICCGRRAPLEHFFLLATRFRSLRGELVYAAVDWAAAACLRSACHRLAGEQETEPRDAWPARGGRLRHARFAPRAYACGRSPC